MSKLTINLLTLPPACMSCAAKHLMRYCGLAFEGGNTVGQALIALDSRNLSVPEGCINNFGGLNAEGVRKKLIELAG